MPLTPLMSVICTCATKLSYLRLDTWAHEAMTVNALAAIGSASNLRQLVLTELPRRVVATLVHIIAELTQLQVWGQKQARHASMHLTVSPGLSQVPQREWQLSQATVLVWGDHCSSILRCRSLSAALMPSCNDGKFACNQCSPERQV